MTEFSHGIKYDISKHTPPDNERLQVWRGDFALSPDYRAVDNMWYDHWEKQTHVNLFIDETGATHFSLWPVEEEKLEPPTANDIIHDILELYEVTSPNADEIIDHLSRNDYEIRRKVDPWQYGPLTGNDLDDVHKPVMFSKAVKDAVNTGTGTYRVSVDGNVEHVSGDDVYNPLEQEPKSWEQYLNCHGDFRLSVPYGDRNIDFYHNMLTEDCLVSAARADQILALRDYLNHHLKETT